MTITSTPSEITYAGDGVSTVFTIPFVFDTSADLKVVETVAGLPTVVTTGFSIAGGAGLTGTLTRSVALPIGTNILILDNPALTQPVDYVNNDAFPATTHEGALDRLTRITKRLNERVDRSLRVADGDLIDGDNNLLPIASVRAGKFGTYDAQGRPSVASGTGNDSALRTDLAATVAGADGSRLVGYRRPETGSVARSVYLALLGAVVSVADFGAVGDGATDDSAAFQAALNFGGRILVPETASFYKIGTPLTFVKDNTQLLGLGRPLLKPTTNGKHVISGVALGGLKIESVRFTGTNSATTPTTGFGGYAAANTGLVTLAQCTDARIEDCDFDTFCNGVAAMECTRTYVVRNRLRHFLSFGIVGSCSKYSHFDFNAITECDQSGGVVAYGIILTGDAAGGKPQERCTAIGNVIDGVPSWDGIMSHDCDGLVISDNDIRNVRNGVDVGHFLSTNVVTNVRIANNYLKAATSNTWGGVGAQIAGIAVIGFDATHRVQGAVVIGNILDGFFNASMGTSGGVPSHIVIQNCDDFSVLANVVENGGTLSASAGIYLGGTLKRGTVLANSLQGTFALGGVRLATVTGDALTIGPNTCLLTTASDNAVAITSSTVTQLQLSIGANNSTAPFSQGASTLTFSGDYLEGSVAYDPPNLADGAGTTTTITVTGAALGDIVAVSFNGDTAGIIVNGWVSAANTVSVRFQNESGGAVDLGSATLLARVYKKH